ncbi:polygalacturonase [Trifolium pratense]|uniref:Polygalacturonase n=1 Tax=Trifolium pratense TaxID=57577 RepID=A0A2K3PRS6_TRIPR|nr:polygalacturonase [Trifolium pratense]
MGLIWLYIYMQAFMDGWQATCKSKEQARLLIPPGTFLVSSMFFSGPCLTPGPVTIQVVGTVLATTDISEYENSEWLMFQHIEGLKLLGGVGAFERYDCQNYDEQVNAHNLYFDRVTNGVIQNIKSVNPKGFHIFVTNSGNMRLRLIKINAPATSPNTDGIHISHSINVKISRTSIETGDDCVSMIQGVNNVTIKRLKCGPGHGLSIGSLGKYQDELPVNGIRVQATTLVGTTNGLRIKSWPDKYTGSASDIHFIGITMENVKNPIIIDQEYECDPECKKKLYGHLDHTSDD